MAVTESTAFSTGAPYRVRPLPSRETLSGSMGLVTTSDAVPDDWTHEVRVQIKELLLLDDGWDGAVAAAIDGRPVELAIYFVTITAEQIAGIRRPYVSPTANGGVNLEWHSPHAHFDVTFEDEVWIYASSAEVEWEGPIAEVPANAVGVLLSHFVDR